MKQLVLHASPFEVKSLNCRLDLPCKIMSLVTTCFVFVACAVFLFVEMHKARMNGVRLIRGSLLLVALV